MDILQAIIKNRKKSAVFISILLFIILLPFGLFSLRNVYRSKQTHPPSPSQVPGGAPLTTALQQPFHVIDTSPKDGEQNVSAGEVLISFTTDVDLISQNSFILSISPPLPYYWKFINTYPTRTVQAQVYGGLQPGSGYTLSVQDQNHRPIYNWSFMTSQTPAESSSNLIKDQEQQKINQYYPLLQYVPYSTADFSIDYTGHLTLDVQIKNSDVDKVKQEVLDWIRSHGVDPSTHTINFSNDF